MVGEQAVEEPVYQGTGQAVFSPDGSKYAILNTISDAIGGNLDIYDFDRCSGLLNNHIKIHLEENNGSVGGLAISPNSQYLYMPYNTFVYQYDLWVNDIEASRITVAIYDGFNDWLPTTFFAAQLAPDGKIYIICPNGVWWMHTIKYPNKAGEACVVEQHSVRLPTLNSFSIPNNPNYRLGPIDGSPCDTLGISNIPLSNFRADQSREDYHSFYFQDLSSYEPTDWQWSFGDGTFSQDTSPVHFYLTDGVFEVCLTVSNENGSHTACDTLRLGIVNTNENTLIDLQPQLFPNPFKDQFSFVLNEYYPKRGELRIFDGLGRPVHQQRIFQGWNTVDGSEWGSGVYFWEFWDGGVKLETGRIMQHY